MSLKLTGYVSPLLIKSLNDYNVVLPNYNYDPSVIYLFIDAPPLSMEGLLFMF